MLLAIFLLATSLLQGQMSHAQLTSELLKDLDRAIADSTGWARGSYALSFQGDSETADYLNELWSDSSPTTPGDSLILDHISVQLLALELSVNRPAKKSGRNMKHTRMLAMQVIISRGPEVFAWTGRTEDQLTAREVEQLLTEPYPVALRGDFRQAEPGTLLLAISTLGVFGTLAALFFIRT